jgi:xanthine/uracil permease
MLLFSDSNINCLGAAETIILGFQHYILMLGTTVMVPTFLVPAMGGNDVSASSYDL